MQNLKPPTVNFSTQHCPVLQCVNTKTNWIDRKIQNLENTNLSSAKFETTHSQLRHPTLCSASMREYFVSIRNWTDPKSRKYICKKYKTWNRLEFTSARDAVQCCSVWVLCVKYKLNRSNKYKIYKIQIQQILESLRVKPTLFRSKKPNFFQGGRHFC